MPGPAAIIPAIATVAGSAISANAAKKAANTQAAAAAEGTAEQRRQFDAMRALQQPYVEAGTGALGRLSGYESVGPEALAIQRAMAGLGSPEEQDAALRRIEQGPLFAGLMRQGENAILQNASATGGLRGGNVQAALAQFRPQLLSSLMDRQYSQLGGLTALGQGVTQNLAALGQASASGVGAAGLATGQNIANLMGQQGAAQAGGILGQANAGIGALGNIGGLLAQRFAGSPSNVPAVVDDGYSIGQGSAYGGSRAGL